MLVMRHQGTQQAVPAWLVSGIIGSRIVACLAWAFGHHANAMRMPEHPVSLSPVEIEELNLKLSRMRHDINNYLTLMVAAAELIRRDPQSSDRRVTTILDQVPRATTALAQFSAEFEKAFDIKR
jgi:hypothetical protein